MKSLTHKEKRNSRKKETKEERGKHIDQWYIRITQNEHTVIPSIK